MSRMLVIFIIFSICIVGGASLGVAMGSEMQKQEQAAKKDAKAPKPPTGVIAKPWKGGTETIRELKTITILKPNGREFSLPIGSIKSYSFLDNGRGIKITTTWGDVHTYYNCYIYIEEEEHAVQKSKTVSAR